MSQPFTRLLWDWYSWWASWFHTGRLTWITPGGSTRFWEEASCWHPVDCGHPTWVKIKNPGLVVSPSWATLAVPPACYCSKFQPPTSGTCPTYISQSTLTVTLSGEWPTIHHQHGFSWICHKAKGVNKLEIKLERLVVLGVFFVSNMSSLHVIGVLNRLVTPRSYDLINNLNDDSSLYPNFYSSEPHIITDFSEVLPPWWG